MPRREVITEVDLGALVETLNRLGVKDVEGEIVKLRPRPPQVNARIASKARSLYASQRQKSTDHSGGSAKERNRLFILEFKDLSEEEKEMWWNKAMESVDDNGYVLKEKKEEKEAGAKEEKKEEKVEFRMEVGAVMEGEHDALIHKLAEQGYDVRRI
mmetsp:Transcript_56206/g.114935  ORF Transcript_56206/g.114935 Transcript_56206/m.114935 type:complete len:157 (-) Transcript_56206:47-517(-)